MQEFSTDADYRPPNYKHTADSRSTEVVSEWQVFNILDKLPPTATGMDQLPVWLILRLGAPVFSKLITHLFNISISTSTVPHQWKQAAVPKVATPSVA